MSHNIFSQLLNLYRSNLVKVPVEDYITEVFSGLLNSEQKLLDDYINNFLHIEGSDFTVKTQVRYPTQNSIVDMVFENKDTICFVENKVESSEGNGQLEKYSLILGKQNKRSYLVYCTKYLDNKDKEIYESNCKFIQCRWADIYDYFSTYPNSQISNLFIDFMEHENLNSVADFNVQNILTMQNFYETIQKMDESLQVVSPEFTKYFGVPYTRDLASLKQIQRHNRYAIWTDNVLNGDGYSEILLAFGFDDNSSPSIYIQFWCDKNHEQHLNFSKVVNKYCPAALKKHDELGTNVWYESSLLNFIASDNQFVDIKNWFEEHILKFNEFKLYTQEHKLLEWV